MKVAGNCRCSSIEIKSHFKTRFIVESFFELKSCKIEMLIVKVWFLTLICGVTAQKRSFFNEVCSKRASSFVKAIIKNLNAEDSSTRDVVLLKLGMFENSTQNINDILNILLKSVPSENLIITPNRNEVTELRHIKKNVVIIIVSDVSDTVSWQMSCVGNEKQFFYVLTYVLKGFWRSQGMTTEH